MTIDMRYLSPTLSLRHATLVDDPAEASTLMTAVDDEDPDALTNLITEHGRFVACRLANGQVVVWTADIRPIDDRESGATYEYVDDEPTVYRADGTDREVVADVRRLYLAHSLTHGAYKQLAGWRDRIVALIPEEVGTKESKIVRTTANGDIVLQHEYAVLDAYGTYARWVNDLAAEFGGGDELIGRKDLPKVPSLVRDIAHAWLQREAADAQLDQARHSLKFALGGHARMLRKNDDNASEVMSIAELARSFYTDRPNLSRVISQAEKDRNMSEVLDAIESGDTDRILTTLKQRH